MCGSLLSKFSGPNNAVQPEKNIGELEGVRSQTTDAFGNTACYNDKTLWKEEGPLTDVCKSKKLGKGGFPIKDKNLLRTEISGDKTNALNSARPVLPVANSGETTNRIVPQNKEHLLETAREILAFRSNGASSSSNTVVVQPLSSVCSTLPGIKMAVAFDIPVAGEKTVCPSARVPRRLRKSRKVAPEMTLENVKEKIRAAEERKLKELERIRGCARSRAGVSRPHRADVYAQVTKDKIATKQAAAEKKRNEEISKRKEAGNKASRSRNRIAEARAFAKSQLESSIERKLEDTQQRKEKKQKTIEKQKKLQEKYAKKIKDRVSMKVLNAYTNMFLTSQESKKR